MKRVCKLSYWYAKTKKHNNEKCKEILYGEFRKMTTITTKIKAINRKS